MFPLILVSCGSSVTVSDIFFARDRPEILASGARKPQYKTASGEEEQGYIYFFGKDYRK